MSKIGLPDSLAAHITISKSSAKNKWLLTWLPTFLGVALAMILIPFFLLFFNKIITLAWRHHKRSRDGAQIQDFRSWYSRIGLKNHLKHTRHRRSSWSAVLNKLGIKHVATDYTTWFWAPEESRLVAVEEPNDVFPARYASPGWLSRLGSRLRQNSPMTSSNTDHELEKGTSRYSLANAPNPRLDGASHEINHAQQCSLGHSGSVPTMSGALNVPCDLENMSTIRRRHMTNGQPWFSRTDNEDIRRATSEELGIATSGQENKKPSEESQASSSPHRSQSFAAQLGRLRSIATRRIISMPITSPLSKVRHEHQEPRKEHLSPQKTSIPELYRSRDLCNLHVPANSEDTSALNPLCRKNSINSINRIKRSKSMSNLDVSKTSCDQHLVDDIDNRLKWLIRQNGKDCAKGIGSKHCGTSGRSGSPVTAHACESTSPAMFLDDMSAYEAKGSLDEAVSRQESITSTRMDMLHLSQYRKLWDNLSVSHASSLSKSMPPLRSSHLLENNTFRSSLSRFATHTAKAPSATAISTLKLVKRKRAVDRGIHVSMQKESENEQEELNALQSFMSSPIGDSGLEDYHIAPVKRSPEKQTNFRAPSLLSSPHMEPENLEMPSPSSNRLALMQNKCTDASPNLEPRDSLSPTQDFFVQSLHTKLDRLHYELSPGFRSPAPVHWKIIDENVPIWSQGPHKLSMPSRRRKLHTLNAKSRRRSTASLLEQLPPETTSPSPALISWRIELNRLRCRAGIDPLHSHAPISTALPDDTGIDTAAYILHQPPDGIGPDPAAANMLYLGAFGQARTLAHWQHGSRKRASSPADLPPPGSKSLRRVAPMAKVRLERDGGVWQLVAFVLPAPAGQLDGGPESGGKDVEGRRGERAG
ncbi:hypothetical protein MMC15_000620 [Xylographa vitiligo]|nr:hypothetical protein [Xylographa vitiligo]